MGFEWDEEKRRSNIEGHYGDNNKTSTIRARGLQY
jgi:uncharacterized DUF497 family protein